MVILEPLFSFAVILKCFIHDSPKAARVIWLYQMSQFMYYDIIYNIFWRHDQTPIKTKVSVWMTRPPATFGAGKIDVIIAHSHISSKEFTSQRKQHKRLFPVPALKYYPRFRQIAFIQYKPVLKNNLAIHIPGDMKSVFIAEI